MKISIVIPTVKNDPYIKDCLYAIHKAERYKWIDVETIVVNLGKERSEQRNVGILKATGDYILILDADQRIDKRLLIESMLSIQTKGYEALYFPERIIGDDWFSKLRNFERLFYTGTAVDVPRLVKRSLCPMFDESMSGPEDADWGNRIKGKKGVCKCLIYHDDKISLWDYIKKKNYYAKSMKRFKEKNPGDKVLNIKYRCWTVFTENGKWRLLAKNPKYALGIIFLLAVRGAIWIKNSR